MEMFKFKVAYGVQRKRAKVALLLRRLVYAQNRFITDSSTCKQFQRGEREGKNRTEEERTEKKTELGGRG